MNRPNAFAAFVADLRRNQDPQAALGVLRALVLLQKSWGLRALLGYRFGQWLRAAGTNPLAWPLLPPGWLLYYAFSRYVRALHGIRLELSARIGGGLDIDHFGDIVVRDCVLGSGCAIRQSVHIEPGNDGPGPVVGDGVWFGARARAVGPYRIGDGCTVGAGAVVKADTPARSMCVGDPARPIWRNYDNSALHAIYRFRNY